MESLIQRALLNTHRFEKTAGIWSMLAEALEKDQMFRVGWILCTLQARDAVHKQEAWHFYEAISAKELSKQGA